MAFIDERPHFEAELDALYATYPTDVSTVMRRMDEAAARHPNWSSYRLKALVYETAAEMVDVHVFRHCPFYYELKAGRGRKRWGFDGVGAWLRQQPFGRKYERAGAAWKAEWHRFVAFNGQCDTDLDHHSAGYDNVLRKGLNGIAAEARARLDSPCSAHQRAFLESAIMGCESLSTIAMRFAERARTMADTETDPLIHARLERMADTAARVPAEPPETFFGALNTLLFMREVLGSLEGVGISTFGHVDRMLGPYLAADLAAERLSRDEASDLIQAFLAITDVKFLTREGHNETSTTVFIGGCDSAGTPVFNHVTRLLLDGYLTLRIANPKLQARLSPAHPDEYLDRLAAFIGAGTNVMAVYNDPVIIEANTRQGKRPEDARLYVGGGCQENILQNTEISSRATLFFSLAAVLEMSLFPEQWQAFAAAEGIEPIDCCGADSFDTFYAGVMRNLGTVVDRLIANRNRLEADGGRYNPCPMLSATIDDCIAKARDMTEGGCRYSTGSVDLAGMGTWVDSLYAIRTAVFEQRQIPMAQLKDMLAADFTGEEAFRQFLIRKIPKYGRDEGEIQDFAAKVFADVAAVTSGRPNARGGVYGASLFSHTSYVRHGERAGATPDGRRAGTPLSKSMGPSTDALGQRHDIGSVLRALQPIDMTDYPVVGILDIKLPAMEAAKRVAGVRPLLERFMDVGGSVLQVNTVDAAVLREARDNPRTHPDLIVRVSGFSVYFTSVPATVQDEIIRRTELQQIRR